MEIVHIAPADTHPSYRPTRRDPPREFGGKVQGWERDPYSGDEMWRPVAGQPETTAAGKNALILLGQIRCVDKACLEGKIGEIDFVF